MPIIVTPKPDWAYIELALDYAGVNEVTVERALVGQSRWIPVRSGLEITLIGGQAILADHEAPMDVALKYRVTRNDPLPSLVLDEVEPYTLASGGWSWLKDPASSYRNVRLDEVETIAAQTYTSRAGVFDVIDRARPVVVAAKRQDRTSELIMFTATEQQRLDLLAVLANGQVLMLATPGSFGWGTAYIHVGDAVETRVGGLGAEATRRWSLPMTVVDRPAALSLTPPLAVWSDVITDWATWSDVLADNEDWQELIDSGAS